MSDAREKTGGSETPTVDRHAESIRILKNAPGQLYARAGEVLESHHTSITGMIELLDTHQKDIQGLREQMSSALRLITTPRQ